MIEFDFFFFLILFCIVSFLAIVSLLAWRIYLVRNYKNRDLLDGIISSKPFFDDFEKIFGSFISGAICVILNFFSKKEAGVFKKCFYRFSDYVKGKRLIEKNGCKGYWKKLDGIIKREEDKK